MQYKIRVKQYNAGTAQLLAFRLEYLAPCIVGISVVFWKCAKSKRDESLAEIFIGFGIMFIGMIFMEMGMGPLTRLVEIRDFLYSYSQPDNIQYLILILVGFLITALVHSSSMLTGVMIAMSAQGMLPLKMAVPLIMGINVGKCLTALWASRDASRTARRAAIIHLLFNLTGTIVVVLFFQNIMVNLLLLSSDNLPRQIANAHTLFNIGTTILCFPFVSLFVKVSDLLAPAKKQEEQNNNNLDVRMLETPGLALAQTYNEIINLTKQASITYDIAFRCVVEEDERELERVLEIENLILRRQKDIEIYLVKLAQKNITKGQHEMLNLMLEVSGDIELVSDLSINIAKLAIHKKENSIPFSQDARQEIMDFHQRVYTMIVDVIKAMEKQDIVLANNILSTEIKIKSIERALRENHIERLAKGLCSPGSGVMFMDLINNMEHVAEHIKKISYFVIEVSKF